MNIGSKSLKKLVYRIKKALNDPSSYVVYIGDIRLCNDVKAYIKLLQEYREFKKLGDQLYWE